MALLLMTTKSSPNSSRLTSLASTSCRGRPTEHRFLIIKQDAERPACSTPSFVRDLIAKAEPEPAAP